MEDLTTLDRFDDAFRRLHPLALRVARRVLDDPLAAEDVAQDVFLALWRNPRSFDPARGSLRAYVLLLARSRALDRLRTRAVAESAQTRLISEARASVRDCVDGAEQAALGSDRRRRVLSVVADLPAEQRDAVLLAFGRGLTMREIADGRGVALGTAKSRVRLGLARVREQLGEAA